MRTGADPHPRAHAGLWFDQISFLLVTLGGTRLRFFVPKSYTREQVRELLRPHLQQMVIANHRTEIDWFYFWPLAARWGGQSMVRIMLKSVLRHAPGPGWAMQLHRFPFVHREWAKGARGMCGRGPRSGAPPRRAQTRGGWRST